jgi:Fe-S-cluster containining protein
VEGIKIVRLWVHPCRRCGACCATFRVSFYWAEAGLGEGQVPEALTEQISPTRVAMLGTNRPNPRCVALEGEIGVETTCTIHAVRSTPCRDFEASWESGTHNPRCDAARARHGLAPLQPEDWYPLAPNPEPPAPPLPHKGDDDHVV